MPYRTPKTIDWDMLSDCFSAAGLLMMNVDFTDLLASTGSKLGYLATPYSKQVLERHGRWCSVRSEALGHEAAWWAGHLAANGVCAISPIVQSVSMVEADRAGNIDPLDARFWENWCRPLLLKSEMIIIPPITGWRHSSGIWNEAWRAVHLNVPVYQIRAGSEFGGVS